MNLFFDTSALVKFFHEEEGTESVTAMIRDTSNQVWILDLVAVEYASAVFRRYRNHEMTDVRLEQALKGFDEQCADFHIEPLTSPIVQEAERLLHEHGRTRGLRTLDALHLAGYGLVVEQDWAFVTADDNQTALGRLLGWSVLNPM